MSKLIDITGQRFGKWIVLKRSTNSKNGQACWLCRCICGRELIIRGSDLRSGNSTKCKHCSVIGNKNSFRHGQYGTRLYWIWKSMIQRCENLNHIGYKHWGGRGISVYSEWHDAKIFFKWALINGYKEELQIDRIDNDGGYGPGNCRFVTAKEQHRNRRGNRLIKIGNKTKLLCEWVELSGIKRTTLMRRIELGWSGYRLLEPARKHKPYENRLSLQNRTL